MRLILPLLLATACTASVDRADPAPDPIVHPASGVYQDLVYGEGDASVLDLYRDPDPEVQQLAVFLHGGSWVGGDKENLATTPGLVDWFADRGYAMAAPNFRRPSPLGAPDNGNTITDMLHDAAEAVGWLRAFEDDYGLDTDEIVLIGFSSGAHLTALLASDSHYLANEGVEQHELHAAISLDVHAYDIPLALELMEGSELDDNRAFIHALFGEAPEGQLALSPVTYIDSDVPKSLLVSAEPSQEVTSKGYIARETSRIHAERLHDAGHSVQHAHFDTSTHNGLVTGFGMSGHPATDAVEAFLSAE